VGCIMRELTALEIDQLDFSGRIPEVRHPEFRNNAKKAASGQTQNNGRKIQSRKIKSLTNLGRNKKRPKIGIFQTA